MAFGLSQTMGRAGLLISRSTPDSDKLARRSSARCPSSAFQSPLIKWVWELKLDGFRALAHVEGHQCKLISRNGHTSK
jgi:ATP-dependent DNA ligase